MQAEPGPRKLVNPLSGFTSTKPGPNVANLQTVRQVFRPPTTLKPNAPPTQLKKEPRVKRCMDPQTVLVLLLLVIIIAFPAALLLRFVTRGPEIVIFETAPTESDAPGAASGNGSATGGAPRDRVPKTNGTESKSQCDRREDYDTCRTSVEYSDDLVEPTVQLVGQEKHEGNLPGDVKPAGYKIAMTLTGSALGPTMNVTGRVVANFIVSKATDRVVLVAKADTLKDIRVAMLNESGSPCSKERVLPVLSVSRDADYLIIRLKTPLVAGHSFTLVTMHSYQPTTGGPITLKQTLGRMQLEVGKAHAAFPCYEKKGLLLPMELSVTAPHDLTVIANEDIGCMTRRRKRNPTERTFRWALQEWQFAPTIPMPPHKLAWAVIPRALRMRSIASGLRQFAKKEDVKLTEAVKRFFPFLQQYFQDDENLYISKLDFVLGTEVQDSLGFLLLKTPIDASSISLCYKVAEQWTGHLLPQYSKRSWLASSGVTYLCRLALANDEDDVKAAFQPEINTCLAKTATDDIKGLLAFRMAHLAIGDAGTRIAIQKHVNGNLFKDAPSNDATLGIFDPILPKKKMKEIITSSFQTVKLVRTFGETKKLTWQDPKGHPVLVATNSVTGAANLKAPRGFNVSWLDTETPETDLRLDDNVSLFVNPVVMACYGVELDNKSWALVGHEMEMGVPNALNIEYLLSQASAQYAQVTWPQEVAGFLWACGVLKDGNRARWDQYAQQFMEIEHHAYTMMEPSPLLDKAYKERVQAIIQSRVDSINPDIELAPSAKKKSAAVALANVACFVGSKKCAQFTAGLENLIIDANFKMTVQARTLISPEAVACRIGSEVSNDDDFNAKVKGAPISMRLALAACLREGVAEASQESLAVDVLHRDLDSEGTTGVRLSAKIRGKIIRTLSILSGDDIPDRGQQSDSIRRAIELRAFRTTDDVISVYNGSTNDPVHLQKNDTSLEALTDLNFNEYELIEQWAKQLP